MMATPGDLEDLAVVFSVTEELTRPPADLEAIEVVKYSQGIELQTVVAKECEAVIAARTRRLAGRTGCGICGSDIIEAGLNTLHHHPPRPAGPPGPNERPLQLLPWDQAL